MYLRGHARDRYEQEFRIARYSPDCVKAIGSSGVDGQYLQVIAGIYRMYWLMIAS